MASCEELIAALDWERTPLGPRDRWPESLRATVDNMLRTRQPMLLFWGPEWTQFYNDAFVPSFGQGKHPAAMGQGARECWADAWPVVGAQLEAVVERGEPSWHEDTLVPIFRNGRMEEVFWTYSYSPAHDDDGAVKGVLVIVTEMTARVLAARRLSALARLGLALSTAVSHDDVHRAVLELAREEPHDLPFVIVVDGRGRRSASRPVELELAGTGVTPLERPVASEVWPEPVTHAHVSRVRSLVLTVGLSPRLPADQAYLGFLRQLAEQVAVAFQRIDDAHERERSEQERTTMLLALEEANRAKDEFLAMLGHELRNPLAPIVAALELMKQRDPASTAERQVIERQIGQVVRLVDDLLDVARIARGQLTLEREHVDIAEVVASAIDATAALIEQRGHRLSSAVEAGLSVEGDSGRLVQVVSNLLVNAARYTPAGGQIEVGAVREGDDVVVRVSDTGQGVAAELAPTIFDLFVQGKRSADRRDGGLGIGLAIVKNLVAVHGGTVSATSAGAGRGSTFTVRLPARAPSASRPALAGLAPASTPRRVLLVDDNEDAVYLLGEVARAKGHQVAIAQHPDAALELIGEFTPDVAVLDIGLPTLDGYELGKRIRQRHPDCRIIALTGYGQPRDRERSASAGFFAHLVKPVRIDVFLEILG